MHGLNPINVIVGISIAVSLWALVIVVMKRSK